MPGQQTQQPQPMIGTSKDKFSSELMFCNKENHVCLTFMDEPPCLRFLYSNNGNTFFSANTFNISGVNLESKD